LAWEQTRWTGYRLAPKTLLLQGVVLIATLSRLRVMLGIFRQKLDGDLSLEHGVSREEDLSHPTLAQGLEDFVLM